MLKKITIFFLFILFLFTSGCSSVKNVNEPGKYVLNNSTKKFNKFKYYEITINKEQNKYLLNNELEDFDIFLKTKIFKESNIQKSANKRKNDNYLQRYKKILNYNRN